MAHCLPLGPHRLTTLLHVLSRRLVCSNSAPLQLQRLTSSLAQAGRTPLQHSLPRLGAHVGMGWSPGMTALGTGPIAAGATLPARHASAASTIRAWSSRISRAVSRDITTSQLNPPRPSGPSQQPLGQRRTSTTRADQSPAQRGRSVLVDARQAAQPAASPAPRAPPNGTRQHLPEQQQQKQQAQPAPPATPLQPPVQPPPAVPASQSNGSRPPQPQRRGPPRRPRSMQPGGIRRLPTTSASPTSTSSVAPSSNGGSAQAAASPGAVQARATEQSRPAETHPSHPVQAGGSNGTKPVQQLATPRQPQQPQGAPSQEQLMQQQAQADGQAPARPVSGAPPPRPPRLAATSVPQQQTSQQPYQQQQQQQQQQQLQGQQWSVEVKGEVQTITFNSADNGFKIVKVKVHHLTGEAPVEKPKYVGKTAKAKALASRSQGTVTVLGPLSTVAVGMSVVVRGRWETNATHGQQLRVSEYFESEPEGDDALERYLAGSMKGVGPKTAALLVDHFGADVLRVLDSEDAVKQLRAVKGLGKVKAAQIKEVWDTSAGARGAMLFLTKMGIRPELAKNVAALHGADTEARVSQDPYTAMWDAEGYSFAVVDQVAAKLGIDGNFPSRGMAALQYVLELAAAKDGHTYLPWHKLQEDTKKQLSFTGRAWTAGGDSLKVAAKQLRNEGKLVVECEGMASAPMYDNAGKYADVDWANTAVCMTTPMWQAETDITNFVTHLAKRRQQQLKDISSQEQQRRAAVLDKWLSDMEKDLQREFGNEVHFSQGQRSAIAMAVQSPISILTGGPGCGKTFATASIVRFWSERMHHLTHRDLDVSICAPTGRAAARLQEIVDSPELEASTIHRLLGGGPRMDGKDGNAASSFDARQDFSDRFKHNAADPIPADAVLVDESSMLDVPLAAALFNAIRLDDHTRFVLVGDPDQLPPVGPGSPLRAAIDACLIPRVDLREVFRQIAGSAIIQSAHAINTGLMPQLERWQLPSGAPHTVQTALQSQMAALPHDQSGKPVLPSDAIMLQLPDGVGTGAVEEAVVQVVRDMLPALSRNWDIQKDVQVLSPTKRGPGGTASLNRRLQPIINPSRPGTAEMPQHAATAAAAAKRALTGSHNGSNSSSNSSGSSADASSSFDEEAGAGPPLWRVGDRVVQMVNDYDRDVVNGDLGTVVKVEAKERRLVVRFPPRAGSEDQHEATYEGMYIYEQLQHAWAITVHKAQGGEFPVVVIPLHIAFGRRLLTRTLLYTALTRGKALVVLVGTDAALRACVEKEGDADARLSSLTERLKRGGVQAGLPWLEPQEFCGGEAEGVTGDGIELVV